ncbi:MAG: hypothetical protein J6W51_06695 [Fibrobacter sp.]|nr:hypothetical protein [Fibrobacter sp.]
MMVVILLPASLRRQCDHPRRNIRRVLRRNVVLHLLEKADEGLALCGRLLALEHRHEHVDALLGKGVGSVPGATPT